VAWSRAREPRLLRIAGSRRKRHFLLIFGQRGFGLTAIPSPLRRARCARWAGVYALAVIYVSLMLGPDGVNFVPRDPLTAWQALLATPYLATGSDQRPDWMANLAMLVPLGFLVTGGLWPGRGRGRNAAAAIVAFLACLLFVVAVKYAQLFFPPRTVSLNYILAQSLGAVIGVAAFILCGPSLARLRRALSGNGTRAMIGLGVLYTGGYFLFSFFPFDVVLSASDLRERAAVLPGLLLAWPTTATQWPLLLSAAYVAETLPIGGLLALARPSWSLPRVAGVGAVLMTGQIAVQTMLLDATPTLAALVLRSVGVALGGVLARHLAHADAARWRLRLARAVPWLALPYGLGALYVKGLLTPGWRTWPQALAAFDRRGLLPFYHDYIVTKAHAAQAAAFELACFAPIGVMVALRRGGGRGAVWGAGGLAVAFAVAVEWGRWLKPGLQPDFSNPLIAGVGAAIAVVLTEFFWRATGAAKSAAPSHKTAEPERSVPPIRPAATAPQRVREPVRRTRRSARLARLCVALLALTAAGVATAAYPLAPWALAAALALYAGALWRWPSLWLAVVPAALPALDLAPWTGWTDLGEADLVALVTIGILSLRAPPQAEDFRLRGFAAVAVAMAVVSCVAGLALGLTAPAAAGGTDNPYLNPLNALRIAKGFATALLLLPFLRERLRQSQNALVWLGIGMTAGLALVVAAALVERALFPGLLDFSADYRIAATFSAMQVGGGYLGAYLAMALPFVLVALRRPRIATLLASAMLTLGAGYALVTTFARTAYAGAAIAMLLAVLAWIWAARRATMAGRAVAAALLPAVLVAGSVALGVMTPFMTSRLDQTAADFAGRRADWSAGAAARGRGVVAALFGLGLGAYPRTARAQTEGKPPSDYVRKRDGAYHFIALSGGTPLYFGQKVAIRPDRTYRLFFDMRSRDGRGALAVLICEKWLLYSDHCQGFTFHPSPAAQWQDVGIGVASADLGRPRLLGWLPRPVEIAVTNPVAGTTIDVGSLRLLDADDRNLLTNGDFARGTERWFFTDDDYAAWRIENQYVMTLVETGVVGLAALLSLAGAGLTGAMRSLARGETMAACVAASLVGFLFCAIFNCLLDSPRLATLFYLMVFTGISVAGRRGRGDGLSIRGGKRRPGVGEIG
jgi:VanZ family protein